MKHEVWSKYVHISPPVDVSGVELTRDPTNKLYSVYIKSLICMGMSDAASPVVESSQMPGAPRYTEDEWDMITGAVRLASTDGDREAMTRICKLHKISIRTYRRIDETIDKEDGETSHIPMVSDVDLALDTLYDECEDLNYIWREGTKAVENVKAMVDAELASRLDDDSKLVKVHLIRERLTALKEGVKRGLGL